MSNLIRKEPAGAGALVVQNNIKREMNRKAYTYDKN